MSAAPRSLAVIPARGGSKGLPGKNTRMLAGLPLLVHSLRCAALCPRITKTIVSTDSEAIAEIARSHGGIVPFLRPSALAQDLTPMMPVLEHALVEMERADQTRYDVVVLLDPTSPGRLPADVEAAFDILGADADADGVIACSRPRFNPLWVGAVEKDSYLAPAFDVSTPYTRRQDVPPFYRINGALYVWRRDYVLRAPGPWWEGRHKMLEIPEKRAVSIDDADEFELLELMIKERMLHLPWLTP